MAGNEGNEKIMRASHADRDQAINRLKAAFVQGRLTKDELVTRAAQAFSARTYADLAALTADLPAGLPAEPAAVPSQPVPARPRRPVHPGIKVGGRDRPDSGGVHDAGRADGRVRYARRRVHLHCRGFRRRGRHRRFRPHRRGSQARGPPPEPLRRPATAAPIPRHTRPSPTPRHRDPRRPTAIIPPPRPRAPGRPPPAAPRSPAPATDPTAAGPLPTRTGSAWSIERWVHNLRRLRRDAFALLRMRVCLPSTSAIADGNDGRGCP